MDNQKGALGHDTYRNKCKPAVERVETWSFARTKYPVIKVKYNSPVTGTRVSSAPCLSVSFTFCAKGLTRPTCLRVCLLNALPRQKDGLHTTQEFTEFKYNGHMNAWEYLSTGFGKKAKVKLSINNSSLNYMGSNHNNIGSVGILAFS